ncbi:hypothetical protein FRX31_029075, partial [Thalictrum thalictroides]
ILEVERRRLLKFKLGLEFNNSLMGLKNMDCRSIWEQQIGGIVQVGAHGTGASLPTMDE